jgi:hypothetical protein
MMNVRTDPGIWDANSRNRFPPADPCDAEAAEQAFRTLMSFVQHCQDEERLPAGDVRSFAPLA